MRCFALVDESIKLSLVVDDRPKGTPSVARVVLIEEVLRERGHAHFEPCLRNAVRVSERCPDFRHAEEIHAADVLHLLSAQDHPRAALANKDADAAAASIAPGCSRYMCGAEIWIAPSIWSARPFSMAA